MKGNKIKVQYSISLWNYFHYSDIPDLPQAIELIRQQSYGIEIWSSWKNQNNLFAPTERKKITPLLENMSVSVHTAGANSFDSHKEQIDTAAEWNAKILVLHTSDLTSQDSSTPDLTLASKIAEYADKQGVKLALENGSLPFLLEVTDKIENMGICLDIGHVYFTPNSLKDFLTALKERIIHLHIQDILTDCHYDLGADFLEHYVPGAGTIPHPDWLLLINTLKQINYQGMAVFEVAPHNPLQTAFLAKTFMDNLTTG